MSILAEEDRRERQAEAARPRNARNQLHREWSATEAAVRDLKREADAAIAEFMTARGYHNHRGQWRKKRASQD